MRNNKHMTRNLSRKLNQGRERLYELQQNGYRMFCYWCMPKENFPMRNALIWKSKSHFSFSKAKIYNLPENHKGGEIDQKGEGRTSLFGSFFNLVLQR